VAEVFKKTFTETDIITRYGGDEFIVLFPSTTGIEAYDSCKKMLEEVRKIDIIKKKDGKIQTITASVGISSVPDHAQSAIILSELADKALYMAKDAGRDTVFLWGTDMSYSLVKSKIKTIANRNRIINNILDAIIEHDDFLVMGHKNPDEDCISSMIAISLLLNKFSRTVYLLIPRKINKNYQYLLNICRYNAIKIIYNDMHVPDGISTVFIMDTPKPDMRETFPLSQKVFESKNILKIEIDHHLEADSAYIGNEGYCLVDEASSASELVGMLAFKLENKKEIIEANNIQDIFSRNFVLAVLTGIIGDSKMGKYLKTKREKWFYSLFSSKFNEMLTKKTRKHSNNFSTMKEVFIELQQLSEQENRCFTLMMAQKVNISSKIGTVIVGKEIVRQMAASYDHETIISVARYAADSLAEYTKLLSLVVYYDDNEESILVQFRIRRSHSYKAIDLRSILSLFKIKNGGGHPGAIGFRIPESEIMNLEEYVKVLITGIEKLMADTFSK
jgi:nanoRNase/pAp phosphatase (c-di-AMP/oligoRNAs hydrolase)